ncbi:hypothetical protein QFW77_13180 [Luteimonas sp. RD2P54]|uniref:Uncharacterized protein n=1 Tax=Luteimonas endophytica TaxID=3042023 RepID=A0ABT6JAS7_9GAMM|nr:hypothetical protein [Luteimonas endophytica]MDH5823931.1 hypothetical protein [Luteimonas endophytica]
MRSSSRPSFSAGCVALATAALLAACGPAPVERDEAARPATRAEPPPQEARGPDPTLERSERAAPPELQPVALGEFVPRDDAAVAATGRLTIDDEFIEGANGARFVTERIAIVRGSDRYRPGERYADALAVGGEQPVELRRVLEETHPDAGAAAALCGEAGTGYIALASTQSNDGQQVSLIGLSGESVPAAAAEDVALCRAVRYGAE